MFNNAAIAREDLADARRGHPDVDLTAYAEARGLTFRGSELAGHFTGLNPRYPEYVFNAMRGDVQGRFGVMAHELYEIPLVRGGPPAFAGGLHGGRTVARWGWQELFLLNKKEKDVPFAANSVWVPTTSMKVQVPEAVFLPRFVLKDRSHLGLRPRLLGDAAPHFGFSDVGRVDEVLAGHLATALAPALARLTHHFAEIELSSGRLRLTVNGYLTEPEQLDHLAATAGALATGAAEVCRPWWAPAAATQALGSFDLEGHPQGWPTRFFVSEHGDSLSAPLTTISQDLHLAIEDPVALHRAAPTLPLPGAVFAAVGGRLPDTPANGRLVWIYQNDHRSSQYRRGGAVFEARPDLRPTPAGGVLVDSTDMYAAARDGWACCWTKESWQHHYYSAEMARRAVATMRATGLAEV